MEISARAAAGASAAAPRRWGVAMAAALGAAQLGCAAAPEAVGATVCGRGEVVAGIDVSRYQGSVDWRAVRASGVALALVRVSDGTAVLDAQFPAHWAGARAAGVLRGAYQYFRPAQDPVAQAQLVLAQLGADRGELPPALDVEDDGGLDPPAVEAAIRTWVAVIEPVIRRPPILYTGAYFWRDAVGGADLTASPLWHAQYTDAPCPTIAAPWRAWMLWQHTDRGTVPGIAGPVSLSRFNGSAADLAAFAAPTAPAAPSLP
jgi:lysozyme